ncbi:Na+/melibiose symporter [Rubidibacter lacunae KORDI 51-2]|uniref:Na+/melibiose symporter n=1 Tax=Rubidibacter lacunae KORDI 51-2 TaxID=582515 RepID=U5DND8_9CHRO|nr:MFS transporter [Rubidibacter lacunae]ERN41215.1 Na+/melibiose symporter [Rubidibacter lacunae KORDI 51-2]
MRKQPFGFWQLWNMSFGFLGIQFGWTLQMANTSAIYEYLGATPEEIPLLWLAAPLSGLIVQPTIGYMSDRTWGPLGRRRPFFLIGAIFSSIALVLMPNSSTLWMAAGLLWILDTSVNVSMVPFRAFVSDLVPESQYTRGFAMQSFFIGAGAVIASLCPWMLNHIFRLQNATGVDSQVPLTVKWSYYIGAAVFLGTVLWTVLLAEEHPPKNMKDFRRRQEQSGGILGSFKGILSAIATMPAIMRQLAWVQFFSWLGIFCVFIYFPPAVSHQIFGAASESTVLYTEGIEWAGLCIGLYNAVCFVYSLALGRLSALTGRIFMHAASLLLGGIGLILLFFASDRISMLLPMACFGLTWASVLTLPYSMLSEVLPVRETGIYMGLFNTFIVIPQIVVVLGMGWVMDNLLDNDPLLAIAFGGISLLVASALTQGIRETA